MFPYTYLIGWSHQDRWYYGVRYAKGCRPEDLWTTYFTSSKVVKKFRETYGEPDVVEVRKRFTDTRTATLWEERVLKRLGVNRSERWLNTTYNGCFRFKGPKNPLPGSLRAAELRTGKTWEEFYGPEKAAMYRLKKSESLKKEWQDPVKREIRRRKNKTGGYSSAQKGQHHWNNGVINKKSRTCPGEGFVPGLLRRKV